MRRNTRQLLYDLEAAHWFAAIGTPVPRERAVQVRSWADALAACADGDWQESRIERANEIRLQLSNEQMQRWNSTVKLIRPEVSELVAEKVRDVGRVVHDIDQLTNSARWDILHACLEWEFADNLRTRFYRECADWYLRGHFPCGWVGANGGGTQMIY